MKNNNLEKIDIVDKNLKKTYSVDKLAAHKKGLLHKIVIAQVIDSKGNFLLVKQAKDRQDPGKYVSPVGGHIRSGESYEDALKREALEELGISKFKYKYIGKTIFQRKILGRDENHYFIIFEIKSDQKPKLNHESVSFKKFSKKLLMKNLVEKPEIFGDAFWACPDVLYDGMVAALSRKKKIDTVDLNGFGKKYQGKVRDYYVSNGKRILITTDRISAFDRVLGLIPGKGAVLNQISAFWFDKTKDIVQNHMISIPHPNVMIAKNVKSIPIEMVVRGYITGVTDTSIWGSYQKGDRVIYGIKFPDGLKKNQKLEKPIVTPTTKAEKGHDERLTEKEIIQRKIVTPKIWREMKNVAIKLFERGEKICAKGGIILVDTKYEFGIDEKGKLILIDEIHTPDSSRFWIKKTYVDRFKKGLEPENFDKEFLRLWYAKRGYKGNGEPPKMTQSLAKQVSNRYSKIYQKITGKKIIYKEFNQKNLEALSS